MHQVSLPLIYKPSMGNTPLYKSYISHINSLKQVIAWCRIFLTQQMFFHSYSPILSTSLLWLVFLMKLSGFIWLLLLSKNRIFKDSLKKNNKSMKTNWIPSDQADAGSAWTQCHGDDYVERQIFIGFEGSLAWTLRVRLQPEAVQSQKANNQ